MYIYSLYTNTYAYDNGYHTNSITYVAQEINAFTTTKIYEYNVQVCNFVALLIGYTIQGVMLDMVVPYVATNCM